MIKRPSELRAEWNALKEEAAVLAAEGTAQRDLPADDPKVEGLEAGVAALALQKDLLAAAAWLGDARDLEDVLLLADVCWDFWFGLGTFPQLPADIDDRDQRQVALAYLLRGVFGASQVQSGAEEAPRRDWLTLLRDAGPNGTAPDPRTAAICGAILDLREVRDTIENALERMTATLNRLADETALTHAIAAEGEARAPS
jgi:hypothetical protein